MKRPISVADIVELSVAERIQFVEDIWDSIALMPDEVELPDKLKKELDKRLDSYHKNPKASSPWKDVRKRLLTQK